jgi:hypothetical protein
MSAMKNAKETAAYRYAFYFAPAPGTAWDEAGSRWVGRCAARDLPLPQPAVEGVSPERFASLTAAPRRYGWHATLKAPFVLAPNATPDGLRRALREVCQALAPFPMPRLAVRRLDDFLALVPADESREARAIEQVAGTLVTGLHGLAAPLPPDELQRRRAAGLTAEEDALLLRWGYPFVLQRFRFHLSLTGSLRGVEESTVQSIEAAARECFDGLPLCAFDAVAIFAEPVRGGDFVLVERVELNA